MKKLKLDKQSGWRYTQDRKYAIHKTYGAHIWYDVRELDEEGRYRLIARFNTLKKAREYLDRL